MFARRAARILLIACGFGVWTVPACGAEAQTLADSILQSAGARGGLCLHIGSGNGAVTADLARSGRYVVHSLSGNAELVQEARRHIQLQKLYGVASVEHGSLKRLPYSDGLANLVVVDDLRGVLAAGGSVQEVIRVLAPRGVAFLGKPADADNPFSRAELRDLLRKEGIAGFEIIEQNGVWVRIVKPRPEEMDEWTHPRHGPDRNPVANDSLVRPPNNLRWISGPRWRGTGGAQLSASGRNIYAHGIVRDAFNGLRLFNLTSPGKYKYVTPLLAVEDRIYIDAPRATKFLQAVDATTGEVVQTYEGVAIPRALIWRDGELLFANSDGTGCVDAATGNVKWMNDEVRVQGRLSHGAPVLALADQRVLVQVPTDRRTGDLARLVCLNAETGMIEWQLAAPRLQGELRMYADGTVVCCDSYRVYPKRIYAYAVDDGRFLWKSEPMNEGKSVGVYVIDGLIWCQHNRQTTGLDIATGKPVRKFVAAPGTFKCALPAATTRYMPGGSLGFLDLKQGTTNGSIRLDRNACGSDPGVLFCNGLTYSFPKQCSCFSMVRGYTAYVADKPLADPDRNRAPADRLVKGPAFGTVSAADNLPPGPADWPLFRHDPSRSASTRAPVRMPLERLWESSPEDQSTLDWLAEDWWNHPALGGPVSSAVAADGRLLVSLANSHRIASLDAETGDLQWQFTAGGRVLTPPTVSGRLCYYGSQDGWAYCVQLSDGALVWKFRAAPADRRIVAHGQLESLWPVCGGVLVEDGRAYFTAGRLSNLVGGLTGYAVDALTGELIWKQSPPTGYENKPDNRLAPAYRNDVPVGGDNVVQIGHPRWIVKADTGEFAADLVPVRYRFVKPKPVPILCSTRDGLWDLSRSKHQGPTDMGHGYLAQEFGDVRAQQLVIRDDRLFGFQLPAIRTEYYGNEQSQTRNALRLVCWDRSYKERWDRPLPDGTEFVSLIAAQDVLFATGTMRLQERPYYKGVLWAHSMTDGSELARIELDGLPAGEGLIAAFGRLYVTMQDGRLLCLAQRE